MKMSKAIGTYLRRAKLRTAAAEKALECGERREARKHMKRAAALYQDAADCAESPAVRNHLTAKQRMWEGYAEHQEEIYL